MKCRNGDERKKKIELEQQDGSVKLGSTSRYGCRMLRDSSLCHNYIIQTYIFVNHINMYVHKLLPELKLHAQNLRLTYASVQIQHTSTACRLTVLLSLIIEDTTEVMAPEAKLIVE